MKIARIYGLDDIIKLNVLAKLMLLERFQHRKYESLVEEVSFSVDGFSKTIEEDETELSAKPTKINGSNTDSTQTKDNNWLHWLSIEPLLTKEDLRPYIFIAKEKAIGFDTDTLLSENLHQLFQMLNSQSDISLQRAQKELEEIQPKDRVLLFDKLELESRSASDYTSIPNSIKGLLRIVKVDPSLELRLINLMDSFPSSGIGPWAVAEFSGLTSSDAKAKFEDLLQKWVRQEGNKTLKQLASQFLKPKQ